MAKPKPPPGSETPLTRKWALIRLILGQAQVIGATITLYFVITTGESSLTIWAALVTALVSGVSIYLFRIRKRH